MEWFHFVRTFYEKSPAPLKKPLFFIHNQKKFIYGLISILLCRLAYRNPKDRQFQPLVSVLLTSYNRPQMVKEAIESVLQQTYQNFELIILDDNSNEETRKVIDQYLKNPKVRFYKSDVKDEDRWKTARYAVLFNIGLEMARGELISYLCDDDYYLPRRLEKMVKFFREHPGVKICYGRQLRLPVNKLRKSDTVLRKPLGMVDACSVMHYKSCADELGNWDTDEIWGADAIFFNKLGTKYPFYPIRETLDVRREHEKSLTSKKARGEHLKR